MIILIKVLQLILCLSILVILHELGHFLPAKFFKTKVEKFYLFFDPWFSLFKKKIGETEYGIGWLPLGGYVKIAGMIDESMDKEQLQTEPQPWEFRSKPAWQRLIIMLGGVTVNFLLAIFIYAMLLLWKGEYKLPIQKLTMGYAADSLQQAYGFRTGDIITGYDNKVKYEEATNSVFIDILLDNAKSVQLIRNGKEMSLPVSEDFYKAALDSKGEYGSFVPAMPAQIDSVMPNSALSKTTAKKGDKLIAVGGQPIRYFSDAAPILKSLKGKETEILLLRANDTIAEKVTISAEGKLGFSPADVNGMYSYDTIHYNILSCFPAGAKQAVKMLKSYVKQFRIIFSSKLKGYKQIGGFGRIGSMFPASWDWYAFWKITAFLSVMLAVMNLLPIPALDGGHVMFTLYEMVTGRKPGEKFMEYAQVAGMILLFGLMIYANGKDLIEFIMNLLNK